jgi:CBS domain-containing protein
MRARDVMSTDVLTVHPWTSVAAAANLLSRNGYAALPVVDQDGGLAGIVTEADVIANRFPGGGGADPGPPRAGVPAARTVAAVMSTPVVGVSQDADVAVVAQEMLVHRRRCVPIIDGSTLVGVITRRDLVKVLARPDQAIAMDVRSHLKYLGRPGRWTVQVIGGQVVLTDEFEQSSDHAVAIALADAVPGVLGVSVRPRPGDPARTDNADTVSASPR